jgi:general stress protein YciG
MTEASVERAKGREGFASMAAERRREIASLGGKSIPAAKRSFSRRRDLASEAGRKGGLVTGNLSSRKAG